MADEDRAPEFGARITWRDLEEVRDQICGCVADDLEYSLGEFVQEILETDLIGNGVTTQRAPQTQISPLKAELPQPNECVKQRFRVRAGVSLQAAAEVVIKACTPEEADRLAEGILQGRPFAEQLHKILEHHTLRVPSQPGQHVDVRLESVLLDWPPEATVWKMTGL
jgi:hypothetical protein